MHAPQVLVHTFQLRKSNNLQQNLPFQQERNGPVGTARNSKGFGATIHGESLFVPLNLLNTARRDTTNKMCCREYLGMFQASKYGTHPSTLE
jgi:hypothetical protein